MDFIVKKGKFSDFATEALVVMHCEGEKRLAPGLLQLDKILRGLLSSVIKTGDFEGKLNQFSVIYTHGLIPTPRIILAGLGKKAELDREKLRGTFAKTAQQIRGLNIKRFAVVMDWALLPLPMEAAAEAAVEGIYLGLYQYTSFKTLEREKIKEIEECVLLDENVENIAAAKGAVKKAATICHAVCFARDLVSAPGNEMTPSDLAREAETIANTTRKTHVKIIDAPGMKELGMNALLSVASGSCQPPKFIILEYRGGRKGQRPVALVGKGLTFDSGGISIKPSESMEKMKTDMAGAAAVMGAIMAAADLHLPLNVVGLIPATENLPGGKAYKPGDVLSSLSGQTIEVTNTDAEGRLILADALTYADRFKPAAIVDIATLTGACVVALGENLIGLLGNDENLKGALKAAAERTSEMVWELPLWEEYGELIKSEIADFKNTSGRNAGTITAAIFLSKFVGAYAWAHLDIAGPAWLTKEKPYIPRGASGVGVRLLVNFLQGWVQDHGLGKGKNKVK